MEAAEVDEGVGAQEEVGDDGGDSVELGCRDAREKQDRLLGLSTKEPWTAPSLAGWETPDRTKRLSESEPSHLRKGPSFCEAERVDVLQTVNCWFLGAQRAVGE